MAPLPEPQVERGEATKIGQIGVRLDFCGAIPSGIGGTGSGRAGAQGCYMLLYGSTLFISSFLLFLVQPLLGKFILPWFGGTPAVWTTCMLFFQVFLLAGYGYAHMAASRLALRRQAQVHIVLLALTLLILPITPSEVWKFEPGQNPVMQILGLLLVSVGAPYLLLASTSPLLQLWFAETAHGRSPYPLYALSNAGSLLAVLAYPVLIEPELGLGRQATVWSCGYAVAAVLSGLGALRVLRDRGTSFDTSDYHQRIALASPPAVTDRILWVALSGCGSLMLLATTNQMCLDVAVVPLLWIVPLSIYLLTYVFCFQSPRWYSRRWYSILLAVGFAWICYVLHKGVFADLRLQIAAYSLVLFLSCMVCHGEMVRLKPDPRHLTAFYLSIAGGGALGGATAALIVPFFFQGYWEYHLGLVLTALLLMTAVFRDRASTLYRGGRLWVWMGLYLGFIALAAALYLNVEETMRDSVARARNFFGVLRVRVEDICEPDNARRTLMHGRIEHGFQFMSREKRYWPTSYFGPESGIGIAIRFHPARSMTADGSRGLSIGVIGLGTGTIAAYGEAGDRIRFYEINPAVIEFSGKYFTYCKDSAAVVEIIPGDARLEMERECRSGNVPKFDVLAVDAFAGDAIPVHLLTRECFRTYRCHLKEDGILALHISNRYFDLTPVVRGQAEKGETLMTIYSIGNDMQGTDTCDWVLLTRNRKFIESPDVTKAAVPSPGDKRGAVVWTDDYSNLFRLFRQRRL